jgi:hypothetical protein
MVQARPLPTQVRHPWRATARTVLAGLVAALPIVPVAVHELGVESVPWVAGALVVIGAATRVLAMPGVDAWLRKFVPWLAASK